MKRPDIATIQTGEDLKRWYWLKSELVAYARQLGVGYNGSKFAILDRLADRLDGRQTDVSKNTPSKSATEWAGLTLTPDTIITDGYTNGENSRRFFKQYCSPKFAFSVAFMGWLKNNAGKTLGDATAEWGRLEALRKHKRFTSDIPAGNQYNRYLRDFFADNPGKSISEARQCWKRKRSLPLGRHAYERSDLDLTDAH